MNNLPYVFAGCNRVYNGAMSGQATTYAGTKPAPRPLRMVQYFVNTRDVETGRDKFVDPAALAGWLEGVSLIGDYVEAREADLERAVGLREALRSLLLANSGAKEADPRAIETLNRLALRLPVKARFDGEGRAGLEERSGSVDGALGHLLGLVLWASADGTWRRLKACVNPECRLAFYDASKNRSGVWCDMALCGNRSKGRAHRERHRDGHSGRTHS